MRNLSVRLSDGHVWASGKRSVLGSASVGVGTGGGQERGRVPRRSSRLLPVVLPS